VEAIVFYIEIRIPPCGEGLKKWQSLVDSRRDKRQAPTCYQEKKTGCAGADGTSGPPSCAPPHGAVRGGDPTAKRTAAPTHCRRRSLIMENDIGPAT
jgi:hypothetical protein